MWIGTVLHLLLDTGRTIAAWLAMVPVVVSAFGTGISKRGALTDRSAVDFVERGVLADGLVRGVSQ